MLKLMGDWVTPQKQDFIDSPTPTFDIPYIIGLYRTEETFEDSINAYTSRQLYSPWTLACQHYLVDQVLELHSCGQVGAGVKGKGLHLVFNKLIPLPII